MTKKETLEAALRGEGCLGKAADDEPVFVLRGKDPIGGLAVLEWAELAKGFHEKEKVRGARRLAYSMIAWAKKPLPAPKPCPHDQLGICLECKPLSGGS